MEGERQSLKERASTTGFTVGEQAEVCRGGCGPGHAPQVTIPFVLGFANALSSLSTFTYIALIPSHLSPILSPSTAHAFRLNPNISSRRLS